MPIEDYIPNVFGQAPMGYEGLLGAERTQGLQKTANLQGLLGAAGALAQGLSAQGPRRSALQNILGAIGGGFQGSQGAYQQGLQQYSQQQQLGMQQRQLAGAEQLKLKYPDLATMIDTNLPGAMRIIADMEQEKRQPKLMAAKPGEVIIGPDGKVIYTAPESTKPVGSIIPADEAKTLGLPAGVIYQRTADGQIKPIEGAKQSEFTGEYGNIALSKFGVSNASQLTEDQRKQVGREWERLSSAKSAAGAPKVNVNVGEKKFSEEFGKGVADAVNTTFNAAQSAQTTLSTIATIKPLISQGVYAGPIAQAPRYIDQLASSLGFASGTTEEKLARTAQAMQGLATLELAAAGAMKGQGSVTENERSLIARAAAGNFKDFTQKEVVSLLDALEKTSSNKIKIHEKNITLLKKRPDTAELADFYEIGKTRKFNSATGRIE